MSNKKQCVDYYGERLKIGDRVIPILNEAVLLKIGGIISHIEYVEKYHNFYITIVDDKGKVLLRNVDARCYTTQERFDERENQNYVYRLVFYNHGLWPKVSLPLTNKTSIDYEIPDDVSVVVLCAEHLDKKGRQLTENSWTCPSYSLNTIYFLILNDGKTKLCHDEKEDFYYLYEFERHNFLSVGKHFHLFETEDELKNYIKHLIEYFHHVDLTHVHNEVEFDKNEKGKEFEKILQYKLEHSSDFIDN